MDDGDWRTAFEGAEEVGNTFASPPVLSGRNLSRLHVDDRGGNVAVAMGFDFRVSSEDAPQEWVEQQFNAFEVSLEFTRVQDLRIDGWAGEPDCRVAFSKNPRGSVDVRMSGTGEHISFTAERARISRFRAYRASAAGH
ncbi:Imm50 family immunity protein [Streptomyces desertarenae]|uniref:Imm50 family immunity protein n=1 Tax=Streptomyces desertarenae TaxID=2666184 RepID=A0ABW4PKN9_9ACTN